MTSMLSAMLILPYEPIAGDFHAQMFTIANGVTAVAPKLKTARDDGDGGRMAVTVSNIFVFLIFNEILTMSPRTCGFVAEA